MWRVRIIKKKPHENSGETPEERLAKEREEDTKIRRKNEHLWVQNLCKETHGHSKKGWLWFDIEIW